MPHSFLLTGGGTGGHIFPAIAVGRVLRERGNRLLFVGTQEGMEARLVPEAGFDMEFIRSGGLNRVALRQKVETVLGLPASVLGALRLIRAFRPRAVFSMGGFVAAPVMLAALLGRVPLVVMEPNAVPGLANRAVARRVSKALLSFPEAAAWFPPQVVETTGLPVRAEFFNVQAKQAGPFTVLITGGSRGSRTLNRAARESWPMFRNSRRAVRIVHQTGAAEHEALMQEFSTTGLEGRVVPFIANMGDAFAEADLVIGRAGAGGVSEIAAAGMPAVLVPFPFAADDHQRKNAEALASAQAARMVLDQEMNGARLFAEVEELRERPGELQQMRERVRQFAHPGAAERAADILEELGRTRTS